MLTLLLLLALATASVAAPSLQYNLYNNGSRGSVTGDAGDFGATYHASAFMSRQGCSTTAKISYCYTGELSADPKKNLETKDYQPWITGDIGTHQRSLLLSQPHFNTSGIITHKVRFHISTTYNAVPVGAANAVTFIGLRNFNPKAGIRALDVRARTFIGEQTSGTFLYVAAVNQDGTEAFPTSYPLKDAIGKTIEVTYTLGVKGSTIDSAQAFVADVTARRVDTGERLFGTTVTKTLYPLGIVDPRQHRLIFGAARQVTSGMKALKVWFGDYSATPAPTGPPE
ncbi:hypothetical protein AURDEDRAFT_156475 [Auricularia subglabra TFB-10046 SS5]|nr:hypothetical protein AURDEDRAFT_156475 [Auricularia subglabra TFB-10046 SS5]